MSGKQIDEQLHLKMMEKLREVSQERIAELEKRCEQAEREFDQMVKVANTEFNEHKATQKALLLVVRAAIAEALNRPSQP